MTGSKKGLYKFSQYFGRMGDLEGLFIATKDEVESLIQKEKYFGEVLGKHSEVVSVIKADDITLISDDTIVVEAIQSSIKGTTLSGINPLQYEEV